MKKIAFHLNCLEQGGAERVVTTLANHFAQEGCEVIIATEWVAENEFDTDQRVRRVHVGLTEEQQKVSRKKTAILRVMNLRKFIKKEKPDVLIAFAQKAIYRALLAKLFTKTPVIVSVRTNPVGHYDRKIDKILIPLLYPRAAGYVFQTQGARDFFAPGVRKKSCIILNPINEKYIGCPKKQVRRKVVVQSGRLVAFKNQLMLLEAFEFVHDKHPDYSLEIYGADSKDGTRELLLSSIAEKKADGYVTLMGASDSLEEDLIDASVFAFSSNYEGLPNALMEAMALGLPIAATDCPCGGPATLLENNINGLLVPVKDAKALADAINYLIENPLIAEKMGDEARKICERANPDAICHQWQEYIDRICEKRRNSK